MRLQMFQEVHHRIVQEKLQKQNMLNKIKKYLKKDIYAYTSPEKRQKNIANLKSI